MLKLHALAIAAAACMALPSAANAMSFTLDFDTPAGGSNIVADGSVSTPLGIITLYEGTPGDACIGCFGSFPSDLPVATFGNGLVEAGSTDDIGLDFGFDVVSITFNVGGDGGGFVATVFDAMSNSLDSLSTADLPGSGLAPGPHTFSGVGIIRSLRFEDPVAGAAIDNVIITSASTPMPEPGTFALAGLGLAALGVAKARRRG